MNISQAQSDALGGCQECQPASAPQPRPEPKPIASVMIADPAKPDWIGIELIGRDGQPVPGEPFVVTMADGTPLSGMLDQRGRIRIEGVEPGTYRVSFPQLDAKEWSRK